MLCVKFSNLLQIHHQYEWNLPTVERYIKKFSPAFMFIKMSQMSHLLHFLLMAAKKKKKTVAIWAKYLSVSEKSHLVLVENAMYWAIIIGFWAAISKMWTLEHTGFGCSFADWAVFLIFLPLISHKWQLENLLPIPFSERTQ